jgi:hypothetical protein
MNINQVTYDSLGLSDEEFMSLIGSGDINSVISRRERIREFLKFNKWYLSDYMKWLKSGTWTPLNKARGGGDIVAKITNAVGMKSCGGCKKRQDKLNMMFPFKG